MKKTVRNHYPIFLKTSWQYAVSRYCKKKKLWSLMSWRDMTFLKELKKVRNVLFVRSCTYKNFTFSSLFKMFYFIFSRYKSVTSRIFQLPTFPEIYCKQNSFVFQLLTIKNDYSQKYIIPQEYLAISCSVYAMCEFCLFF